MPLGGGGGAAGDADEQLMPAVHVLHHCLHLEPPGGPQAAQDEKTEEVAAWWERESKRRGWEGRKGVPKSLWGVSTHVTHTSATNAKASPAAQHTSLGEGAGRILVPPG